MKLIYKNRLIEQDEIDQMKQTHEGLLTLNNLIFNTVVGFTADNLLLYLGKNDKDLLKRELSELELSEFAGIIFHCFKEAPKDEAELEKYVEEVWLMLQTKARNAGVPIFTGAIGNA